MDLTPSFEDQLDALERGRGMLGLEGWRLVRVGGSDAEPWLNDLITARIDTLPLGGSVRSLLLGPTGRIRADLLVLRSPDSLILLQGPGQPRALRDLLGPYVLSSDVRLEPFEDTIAVIPGPVGPWRVALEPAERAVAIGPEALESWRIGRGLARFPIDLDEDSLPAEAGLDEAPVIDRTKGCYLGQESVAKVRNLGHPTRVILPLRAASPVRPGSTVIAEAGPVGRLTSVDEARGALATIARIRWEARAADLLTEDGVPLARR